MLLHVLDLSLIIYLLFHSRPDPFIISNSFDVYIVKIISFYFLQNVRVFVSCFL